MAPWARADLLDLLLRRGADPNAKDKRLVPKTNNTRKSTPKNTKKPFDPSNFSTTTRLGRTALHYAAGRGDVTLIRRLVALPNITEEPRDKEGLTPLQVSECLDSPCIQSHYSVFISFFVVLFWSSDAVGEPSAT
jgi:hypothetical protein